MDGLDSTNGVTLGVSVVGPDGATSPPLVLRSYPPESGFGPIGVTAVWSSDALVVLWEEYSSGTAVVFGATVRCAE